MLRGRHQHSPRAEGMERSAWVRWEGWKVNAKRVERIWRQEGLKVPRKQPNRGRLHARVAHVCSLLGGQLPALVRGDRVRGHLRTYLLERRTELVSETR